MMSRIAHIGLALTLLAAGAAFSAVSGCRQTERPSGVQAISAPAASQPVDAIARSDAERAEAAIERNQREMSGERRPNAPPEGRPVDQPRVGGRR
jgi:hypothetical protein